MSVFHAAGRLFAFTVGTRARVLALLLALSAAAGLGAVSVSNYDVFWSQVLLSACVGLALFAALQILPGKEVSAVERILLLAAMVLLLYYGHGVGGFVRDAAIEAASGIGLFLGLDEYVKHRLEPMTEQEIAYGKAVGDTAEALWQLAWFAQEPPAERSADLEPDADHVGRLAKPESPILWPTATDASSYGPKVTQVTEFITNLTTSMKAARELGPFNPASLLLEKPDRDFLHYWAENLEVRQTQDETGQTKTSIEFKRPRAPLTLDPRP